MVRRSPYILLAFANPQSVPSDYLHALNREETKVFEWLQPYEFEGRCGVTPLGSATIEKVFNVVEMGEKHQDLVLFHYGGHADGGGLLLNVEDGNTLKADAKGLARLLGSVSSLKLVFLNACSTKGQVNLLLKQGIKAVIATSKPVNDGMAVDLADRFYQNLSEGETLATSFQRASDFILSKYSYQVAGPDDTRGLSWEDEEGEAEEDLTWGIYVREGNEDVLNWSLPQEPPKPPSKLGEYDQYACNRAEQNSKFKTAWLTQREQQRVQVFFLHGEEKQSPVGLFKRFVFQEIREGYERTFHKAVRMEEATDLASAKLHLKTALFQAVGLNPNRFKSSELTLGGALKAPSLRDVDCVAIKFKVYSSSWKDFTEEFFQWFLDEFLQEVDQFTKSPHWIFFFAIVYDETTQKKKGLFSRMFSKNPKEKILNTMQSLDGITVLDELPPVQLSDIEKWMDRITDDYLIKEQHIQTHFPGQTEWEMVRVEHALKQIINDYNRT